jgi:hypothetical protein
MRKTQKVQNLPKSGMILKMPPPESLSQVLSDEYQCWDHEISIIVTSIFTDLTMFRRKLDLSSLLIMEIVAIHS